MMDRKKIRDTDIVCYHCGKEKMVVTEGSETAEMLSCSGCGEYIYFIGGITCCCRGFDNEELEDELRKVLGGQELKPEIMAKINQMRRPLTGV